MRTKNFPRAGLIALLLAFAPAAAAEVPPQIHARLQQAGLDDDALAFVAQRASDGRIVASHAPARAMQPASTIKLLTSLVALETLGPAFRGRAVLLANGPVEGGVLNGDLVLRGEGDVDFDAGALERMLRVARMKGVREIRGDLILDRTFFDPPRTDMGVAPFDEAPEFRYNVIPDALALNMNLLQLDLVSDGRGVRTASPTPLEGVSVKPDLSLVDGDCDDWDAGWEAPQVRAQARGAIEVKLRGTFPRNCDASTAINVIERVSFADRMFRALWKNLGGTWGGRARDGATAVGALVIADHRSRPLAEVVRDIDKHSDNPIARMTYLALGAASPQDGVPTAARAEAQVREWLARRDIDARGLVLENGSGLSRRERISPATLAGVLRAGLASPWSPEFVASLPIAAVDGGMRKRLRDAVAPGGARLKTGTLRNASAIAGYVTGRDGTRFVVVAMVNGDAAKKDVARPILDALVEWLLATGFAGSSP